MAGMLGLTIDQLLPKYGSFGGVTDFICTPIGVANIADLLILGSFFIMFYQYTSRIFKNISLRITLGTVAGIFWTLILFPILSITIGANGLFHREALGVEGMKNMRPLAKIVIEAVQPYVDDLPASGLFNAYGFYILIGLVFFSATVSVLATRRDDENGKGRADGGTVKLVRLGIDTETGALSEKRVAEIAPSGFAPARVDAHEAVFVFASPEVFFMYPDVALYAPVADGMQIFPFEGYDQQGNRVLALARIASLPRPQSEAIVHSLNRVWDKNGICLLKHADIDLLPKIRAAEQATITVNGSGVKLNLDLKNISEGAKALLQPLVDILVAHRGQTALGPDQPSSIYVSIPWTRKFLLYAAEGNYRFVTEMPETMTQNLLAAVVRFAGSVGPIRLNPRKHSEPIQEFRYLDVRVTTNIQLKDAVYMVVPSPSPELLLYAPIVLESSETIEHTLLYVFFQMLAENEKDAVHAATEYLKGRKHIVPGYVKFLKESQLKVPGDFTLAVYGFALENLMEPLATATGYSPDTFSQAFIEQMAERSAGIMRGIDLDQLNFIDNSAAVTMREYLGFISRIPGLAVHADFWGTPINRGWVFLKSPNTGALKVLSFKKQDSFWTVQCMEAAEVRRVAGRKIKDFLSLIDDKDLVIRADGGAETDLSEWLLVTDYEGTLDFYSRGMPERLQKALAAFLQRNGRWVIATGLDPLELYHDKLIHTRILKNLRYPGQLHILGELGGFIGYCEAKGDLVLAEDISPEMTQTLQEKIKAKFDEKREELRLSEYVGYDVSAPIQMLLDKRSLVTVLIRDVRLRTYTEEFVEFLADELARDGLYLTNLYNFIVLVSLSTKGKRVREFAGQWGVPINKIIVAGDSENDFDMLRLVHDGATGIFLGTSKNLPPDLTDKLVLLSNPDELAALLDKRFELGIMKPGCRVKPEILPVSQSTYSGCFNERENVALNRLRSMDGPDRRILSAVLNDPDGLRFILADAFLQDDALWDKGEEFCEESTIETYNYYSQLRGFIPDVAKFARYILDSDRYRDMQFVVLGRGADPVYHALEFLAHADPKYSAKKDDILLQDFAFNKIKRLYRFHEKLPAGFVWQQEMHLAFQEMAVEYAPYF
ncbi:MAG: HAD hydrolase family protein, partial [Candidatus Omnitrophica bacterium]|nr:HAD hydrolase family protein [Candidatus Omnitrophota bacterium]